MSTSSLVRNAPRGLDHVVAATTDLAACADAWERLGFRLTPTARHPWGTENRLVQLAGCFVELLGVGDGAAIPEPDAETFSFGAFNRDFLAAHGDGAAMLVAESADPDADRAAFAAAGLRLWAPFGFERVAVTPDGEERRVGFDLTFAGLRGEGAAPDPAMGFFTCRQRFPENFWRAEYQAHPNTARTITAVTLVAPDPSDFHESLAAFLGLREFHATGAGLVLPTPRGLVEVLTPAAFRWRYGAEALPVTPTRLSFAGLRFGCTHLGEAATQLIAGGWTVADRARAFVVPQVHGIAVAFEPLARARAVPHEDFA